MPKTIKAEYRIVVPAFVGDVKKEAGNISPATFKGVLRFWWRAINWSPAQDDTGENDNQKALSILHQQESHLFGSSAEDGTGQAKFSLRLKINEIPTAKSDWPPAKGGSGYLGYGLWSTNTTQARQYIPEKTRNSEDVNFSVEAVLHPSLSSGHIQSLLDAFTIMGLLGGLGSRARRAFGSIALTEINGTKYQFETVAEYRKAIGDLLNSYAFHDALPPFTAFSKRSAIGINSESEQNARAAHRELGSLFKQYRGSPEGLKGPQKKVFGMPYAGGGRNEKSARRASPLLLHIHPIADKFHAVATALPATFHHDPSMAKVDFNLILDFVKKFEEVKIHG